MRQKKTLVAALCAATGLAVPLFGAVGQGAQVSAGQIGAQAVHPIVQGQLKNTQGPPTPAQCLREYAQYGITQCLSPTDVRGAYGVNKLVSAGHGGKGQTILLVDSYGSPTLAHDLAVFDRGYHLPAPPSLEQIHPGLGKAKVVANKAQVGWSEETTLDVEWTHAMAPQAKIVVLTSPVNETEGMVGLPQFLTLIKYAVAHHLGNVISQSWGVTEQTLTSSKAKALLGQFNAVYKRAAAEGISVLAATGDSGAAGSTFGSGYFKTPQVGFPSDSPYVTGVGGTALHTVNSQWKSETAWNDGGGASTGGRSFLYSEPAWQKSLPKSDQAILKGGRGVPDISWNASVDRTVLIYDSFGGAGGWSPIAGTSEASPSFGGLVADVDSARKAGVGDLAPLLYSLPGADFHDITVGNNSLHGVTGYKATKGWDSVTGFGTPTLALAEALIHAK